MNKRGVGRGGSLVHLNHEADTQLPADTTQPRCPPAETQSAHAGALADCQRDLLRASEEIIAFVVDDDEGWEVFDFDLPHGFHAELRVFKKFDLLDAVCGQFSSRTTD